MIDLVTGPPGNGKSYYAMREIANAVIEGRYVATNVHLRPDFAEYIAKRSLIRWAKPWSRPRWKREISRRVHVSDSLEELFSIRTEGQKEGRGLMVLDEAHNWMNARSWSAKDREGVVRFATQHRKLGWDLIIIAQRAEMIDSQVRGNFEHHIEIRNLKRARALGIPICPFNFFLSVKYWHSAQRVVIGRTAYPLGWPKKLYNHMELFAGLEGGSGAGIWLPSAPHERSATAPQRDEGARGAVAHDTSAGERELDPETGALLPALDRELPDPAGDGSSNSRFSLTTETPSSGKKVRPRRR